MARTKIPVEIDPLKLAKDSIGQKKREATKRVAKINRDARIAAKKLEDAKAAEAVIRGEVNLVTQDFIDEQPPLVQDHLNNENVIFKPNPGPQTDFLSSMEDQVFYGGARGGGKSYALLVDPLYHCDKKAHRGLILRRSMPELRDLIAKSHTLYKAAFPGAKWREQEKEWRFPSGARIEFGYAENMIDVLRYQGQSYTWIGVDELPQFPTSDVWTFLSSSLRSVDPAIKPVMRATGNPGNIGSGWVKELFIDPAPSNTKFEVKVEAVTPKGKIETVITRKYIPATVFDNPYLTYDNSYVAMLASLPEMLRRQMLEGDWTAFDGAAFGEFRTDTHVYDPALTTIPSNWQRFRAADWGFTQPACCLWFAVDYDNNLWVYRELHVKGKNAEEFARLVNEAEAGESIRYGVLDSSTWARRGDTGPSIAETMIRAGCRWRPADRSPGSRKAGKMELHRRLALKEYPIGNGEFEKRPTLFISKNCVNLIKTLPLLPIDKNDPEDIDTDANDHAYDALRYGIMSRPIAHEMPFDIGNLSRTNSYSMADSRFGY